jgi:O-antigen ligase
VGAILGGLLPFALVLYLAFRGGGYDPLIRDEVSVGLWLVLMVAAAIGFLPARGLTRASWATVGLLAAFAALTALSAVWSESAERSLDSFVLVAAYLAAFALALLTQGRQALERMLGAVAAAIAVVAVFALASRLHPQWFPANPAVDILPHIRARLNYPLNTWNGLATFLAMGIPLLLAVALDACARIARLAATAVLPVVAVAIYFTLSRGGAIAAVIAGAVFLALRAHRMRALPVVALIAVASVVAIVIAAQFQDLDQGRATSLAHQEGGVMAAIVLAICAATAGIRALLERAERSGRFSRIEPTPRMARRLLATGAVAIVIAGLAVDLPARASHYWDNFKQAPSPSGSAQRLNDTSGNGRYQYWGSSVDAMETAPLQGTGAGTWQFWWARHSTVFGFTAYAHSLYFETLGETGLVGAALICGVVILILVTGVRRAIRSVWPRRRGWLAGATGSASAFALGMGLDWGWHVPVLPIAFFLVAAAILECRAGRTPVGADGTEPGRRRWPRERLVARIAIPLVGLPILALTATSGIGAYLIGDSQSQARAHHLDPALSSARDAEAFMPWAAMPHLQQALVLEEQGEFQAAYDEAREAAIKEPTNWQPPYVLSRIYVELGDDSSAAQEFELAKSLNPNSAIFANPEQRVVLP